MNGDNYYLYYYTFPAQLHLQIEEMPMTKLVQLVATYKCLAVICQTLQSRNLHCKMDASHSFSHIWSGFQWFESTMCHLKQNLFLKTLKYHLSPANGTGFGPSCSELTGYWHHNMCLWRFKILFIRCLNVSYHSLNSELYTITRSHFSFWNSNKHLGNIRDFQTSQFSISAPFSNMFNKKYELIFSKNPNRQPGSVCW